MKFNVGDVVRVEYKSPSAINAWLDGLRRVGPNEIGVVKYAFDTTAGPGQVTVTFPMLGTMPVACTDLVIERRCENS